MRPIVDELLDESDSPAWISMTDVLILTTVLLVGVAVGTTRHTAAQRTTILAQEQRISVLEGKAQRVEELEKENRILAAELEAAWKKLAEASGDNTKLKGRVAALELGWFGLVQELFLTYGTIDGLNAKLAQAADVEWSEKLLRQELLGLRSRTGRLQRVVFVIDRSESMMYSPGRGHALAGDKQVSSRRWEYVQGLVRQWLELLPFEEVGLVVFNDQISLFPKSGGYLSVKGKGSGGRKVLLDHLGSLEPKGNTNTLAALQAAFEYPEPDAIIMFTDGAPTRSPLEGDRRNFHQQILDTLDERAKAPPPRVPVNVVGVGDYFALVRDSSGRGTVNLGGFLQDIADKSGGVFIGK